MKVLFLALLFVSPAFADENCPALSYHHCATERFESQPAGATITLTVGDLVQTCTTPCELPIRGGSPFVMRAELGGKVLSLASPAPAWRYDSPINVFKRPGYVLTVNPVVFTAKQ